MSDVDKSRNRILDEYREDIFNGSMSEDARNTCKEILDDALVVVEELDKLRQEAKKRDLALVSLAEHMVILSRAHDSLEISYRHAINDLGMLCNRARSEGIYNQLYNGLELHNHPDNFDDL